MSKSINCHPAGSMNMMKKVEKLRKRNRNAVRRFLRSCRDRCCLVEVYEEKVLPVLPRCG